MLYFIIIFLLFLLIIIGIAFLIYSFIEAHLCDVSYARLSPSKTEANDTSRFLNKASSYSRHAPSTSSSNLKILFFSDLHAEFCFVKPERFKKVIDDAIENNGIEALVFGGDISSGKRGVQKGVDYINELARYCKEKNLPFLAVTGNHDKKFPYEYVEKCEFINLNHDSYTIRDYEFRGVDDSGRANRIWGDNPFKTNEKTNILLSHNPDWILDAASKKSLNTLDYMLSGHIHGGQIRMPFNFENVAIRKDILPKRKVIKGVFDGAGVSFFISKGLGCVLVPFRFLAKPEITIVEIEKT